MNGVRFWCYHAGHVLGAAMVMIEIAGVKILYTGDFSRVEDRHLMAAEIPSVSPDLLITVSDVMVMSLLVREGSNGIKQSLYILCTLHDEKHLIQCCLQLFFTAKC